MNYECAIEPEILADWNQFRALLPYFNQGQGRDVIAFPKKWKRSVIQQAQCNKASGLIGEVALTKIIEKLRDFPIVKSGRDYDSTLSWHNNVTETEPPFDLILSKAQINKDTAIKVTEDSLLEEIAQITPRQKEVRRSMDELVAELIKFTKGAKKLIIIDPYYLAEEDRYKHALKAILNDTLWQTVEEVVIHRKASLSQGAEYSEGPQRGQLERGLKPLIPEGKSVTCYYWEENARKLHDRFIITESRGLAIGAGIDLGPGSTTLAVLDPELYGNKAMEFDPAHLPEDFPQDHVIQILTEEV